jgi:hypothetical protein
LATIGGVIFGTVLALMRPAGQEAARGAGHDLREWHAQHLLVMVILCSAPDRAAHRRRGFWWSRVHRPRRPTSENHARAIQPSRADRCLRAAALGMSYGQNMKLVALLAGLS